jgi:hypothetical protein
MPSSQRNGFVRYFHLLYLLPFLLSHLLSSDSKHSWVSPQLKRTSRSSLVTCPLVALPAQPTLQTTVSSSPATRQSSSLVLAWKSMVEGAFSVVQLEDGSDFQIADSRYGTCRELYFYKYVHQLNPSFALDLMLLSYLYRVIEFGERPFEF